LRCMSPHERAVYQRLGYKTPLNRPTEYQAVASVSQNANWQSLGQIVNNKILPKIAAARERDRLTRIALGLQPVNWDGQS
jgi:hypothetical protein